MLEAVTKTVAISTLIVMSPDRVLKYPPVLIRSVLVIFPDTAYRAMGLLKSEGISSFK